MEFRPIYAADGTVVLFDLFYFGRWLGSRRTLAQAYETLRQVR